MSKHAFQCLIFLLLFLCNAAFADSRAERVAARVKPVLLSSLEESNLAYDDPVFIRIFKAEKTLEVWVARQQIFVV